jgi:hypothetical protein
MLRSLLPKAPHKFLSLPLWGPGGLLEQSRLEERESPTEPRLSRSGVPEYGSELQVVFELPLWIR